MIRISSKPLLREWTTVQTFKPTTNCTRSFPGCRPSALKVQHAFILQYASPLLFPPARIGKACYSSLPGQSNVKLETDIPPPARTPNQKPKTDFRPAPKKPGQEVRNSTPVPRSPPSTPTQLSTAASSTTAVPPDVLKKSSPSGLLESVKHDVAEATRQGILTPPPQDASQYGKIWHQLKQLLWFYWRGLKLIFITHRQQAGEIRRRVAEARAKGGEAVLSRYETRFLRTYNQDLVRLIPFVLTLLILEEALPFLVLYAPRLLPSTCLLPSQRQRIDDKRRMNQMMNAAALKAELQRSKVGDHNIKEGIKSLDLNRARGVAGMLSLSTWGPLFLQRRRIAKRLAYITSDDAQLVREDIGSRLKHEELIEALEERGFVVKSQAEPQMYEKLKWWLNGANDDKTRLGLLFQTALKESDDKTNTTT